MPYTLKLNKNKSNPISQKSVLQSSITKVSSTIFNHKSQFYNPQSQKSVLQSASSRIPPCIVLKPEPCRRAAQISSPASMLTWKSFLQNLVIFSGTYHLRMQVFALFFHYIFSVIFFQLPLRYPKFILSDFSTG